MHTSNIVQLLAITTSLERNVVMRGLGVTALIKKKTIEMIIMERMTIAMITLPRLIKENKEEKLHERLDLRSPEVIIV